MIQERKLSKRAISSAKTYAGEERE